MFQIKQYALFVVFPIISSIYYRFHPKLDHTSDIPEGGFLSKIWKYWSDQDAEAIDLQLISKKEFELPKWMDGEFVVAGPSKFGMGNKEFNYVLDGFARYNKLKIENNTIKFSSKMLNSKWLDLAVKENDIPAGFIFAETNPARWTSMIPFENLITTAKYMDNNFVMPFRMPDGETYVGLTDTPQMLQFDIDTLEQKGFLQWEDDLKCTMAATHVKNLPNGDMIGICSEVTLSGQKTLTSYRVRGENIHRREVIARVPTKTLSYQHSFGMSKDYIAIFEHPVSVSLMDLVLGFDLMHSMNLKQNDTTKIHLVSIADGTYQTIETGVFFQMLHNGNSFVKDGKFITDATIYQDRQANTFEVMEFKNLKKGLQNINYGNSWKRFEIDLATGELTMRDLNLLKWGNYDLPTWNPKYDGVKENCFTYMMELFNKQVMDESYSWEIIKFDSCQEKEVARWNQPGHLPNEAYFIENPEGESEDDGVLLSVAYDFWNDLSKVLILDAKDLSLLQEYELPFRIPWTFHSGFWRQ